MIDSDTVTVYADPEYIYSVSTVGIDYVELNEDGTESKRVHIGFGSVAEAEAVAKAILKVVETGK